MLYSEGVLGVGVTFQVIRKVLAERNEDSMATGKVFVGFMWGSNVDSLGGYDRFPPSILG